MHGLNHPHQLKIATESEPLVIMTDRPNITLHQMASHKDDTDYLDLQRRNVSELEEFGNTAVTTLAELTARRADRHIIQFAIRNASQLIGVIEYAPSPDESEAEIGIVLDKDSTGKGIATAALRAFTSYLAPHFDRVFAEIDPSHVRSLRLFEHVGYARRVELVQRSWGRAVVMEYPSTANTVNAQPRQLS